MRNLSRTFAIVVLAAFTLGVRSQTAPIYTAIVEQSGAVVCSESLSNSCELSAAAWVRSGKGDQLVFGNDKPPRSSKESSFFSVPYSGGVFEERGVRSFYSFAPFYHASKIEAMSTTADGRYVIAATAFDRHQESEPALDKFNVMIAWPAEAPEKAKIVSSSKREGVESSLAIRGLLGKAIRKRFGEQSTYFKMEGVALLPDNRIIFGIREIGMSYASFDYKVTLLEGRYEIRNGEFELDEKTDIQVVRDFQDMSAVVGRKVGVSSIEYDSVKKLLYVLTSYEDNDEKSMGAYLWVLVDMNGVLGSTMSLVRTSDGAPFEFPHKAEGLAVLGDGRLFVVHDDDRNISNVRVGGRSGGQLRARKPNEAPFDILRICTPDASSECRLMY